jgi:23S rRNA pseudouridine1911/1915/1917 synthase
LSLAILYEDNHLIVVNKRPGVLVQGDETGDQPLSEQVKEYLREKYHKPGNVFAGVVHRLDRPVSGVVVLAKTSKALTRMNALFRENKVKKTYWALVTRRPPAEKGRLVHWLVKDEARNVTTAYAQETSQGLRAELSYELAEEAGGLFLLKVLPVTGRSHQIRAQLASMQCPIGGDLKYGAPTALPDKSICLHARHLGFEHPVQKQPLLVSAPPPVTPWWQPFREAETEAYPQ